MSDAARLYTPELLALAVRLADYPLHDDLPLTGAARSKSCGSTLTIGLATDSAGRISRIGMRAHACAVGQAAAAIFADEAQHRAPAEIAAALAGMKDWLADEGGQPDWPGIATIAPARAFPGRHGAMLLPWIAAVEALSSSQSSG